MKDFAKKLVVKGVGTISVEALKKADWKCVSKAGAWEYYPACQWSTHVDGWEISVTFHGDGSFYNIHFYKPCDKGSMGGGFCGDLGVDDDSFIVDGEAIGIEGALSLMGFKTLDDRIVYERVDTQTVLSWMNDDDNDEFVCSMFCHYFKHHVALGNMKEDVMVYTLLKRFILDMVANDAVSFRCKENIDLVKCLMVFALNIIKNYDKIPDCGKELLTLLKRYADVFFEKNKDAVELKEDCIIIEEN